MDRIELAKAAAREAGELTLGYFRRRAFSIEQKGDGSPVTQADREAEQLLRKRVGETFAGDAFLGEEFGEMEGTSGYRWIVDPIDGTASFVHGVPLYGTLIGVEHDGRMVAGVIHMPALDEMVYAAAGGGAWHEVGGGSPVAARVSRAERAAEAMVCLTSFDYFTKAGREAEFHRVARACRSMRGWSDCYGHLLAATGRIDAVIEPGVQVWDMAATLAVMAEAGGRCTDWKGVETARSGNAVISNGRIHRELLDVLGPG